MIHSGKLIGNSRLGKKQWEEVQALRNGYAMNEKQFAAAMRASGMVGNEGLIPTEVYQDFDTQAVEIFREDNGDTFLNDLLPNSKSLNIGKLTSKHRQVSDAGVVQTSMSGQIGVKLDQTENTFDGSIIPIHDAGFGRNWREWNAGRSENFDALIDDQREILVSVRDHVADTFLDGQKDAQGNFIVIDGLDWQGMRNDSRVAQVDLDASGINFDFTDNTKTGAEIKAAFIQLRDTLWITNKCSQDITYYVSKAIASNFERKFSTQYDAKLIMQELADLMNVAAIKVTSKMTGNELFGIPLGGELVRPLVGMGINTIAMPRPMYNSNYNFVTWGAIGWQVKNDFDGNTCALMAHEIA